MSSLAKKSKAQVEKVREDIYLRDEYRCLAASHLMDCFGGITVQHAMGKGMGGSAMFDSPELLRVLCFGHNGRLESEAKLAHRARLAGWSLKRMDQSIDPLQVPVRYPDGHDYLLGHHFERALINRLDANEWRLAFYGEVLS